MKKILNFKLIIIFLILFQIISCDNNKKEKKPLIIISKLHSEKNYSNRLKSIDSNIVLKNMYVLSLDSVNFYLKIASGILLTGGEDVSPDKYGMQSEINRCGYIDLKRDSIEMQLIDYALKNNIPLLGICRGEQILNVAMDGSLFVDIPTDFGKEIVHRSSEKTAEHYVILDKESFLYSICRTDSGMVNSNHHQAVNVLGKNLKSSAHSSDNLIEAVELVDKSKHDFVIGVQWHPERLDKNHKLSFPIFSQFLFFVKKRSEK